MKNRVYNLLRVIVMIMPLVMLGCKDESNGNCSDKKATNFDQTGICKYSAKYFLWYEERTAARLHREGVETIIYYVDNLYFKTLSAKYYWTGEPRCGQKDSDIGTVNFSEENPKKINIRMESSKGRILYNKFVDISANSCTSIEIKY